MAIDTAPDTLIDTHYPLTSDQIMQFREEGFIKLKDVFNRETLDHYGQEITRLTFERAPQRPKPDKAYDPTRYGRAFLQVPNLWTMTEDAKRFSFSKRLARIATELMGTVGVRMWHDQALYKEAGDGFTPWHVDQQYWPMASSMSVTAWIPLQATPLDMGPLCFGKGSHVKNIGRDLAISDESEREIRKAIREQGLIEVQEPYDLGEVSFHYGWTLHRAGPNTTGQPRKVHTIIYMDEDMRLAEPANENQRIDWQVWTPSSRIGEIMDDALNPVLYSTRD